jgi:hypothetical protein
MRRFGVLDSAAQNKGADIKSLTLKGLPMSQFKSVKTAPSTSPFRGIEQTGVLAICPFKSPEIAWNRTKAALDADDDIRVVVPFPGHVRYYSPK